MNKFSKYLTSRKVMILISLIGVYLLSSGTSWALFSYLKEDPTASTKETKENRARIDPALPKTEACPINGQKFSKPEKEIWESRRPITAVIENHKDARPLSGVSRADVVYEAVAEGGITRFLGVFYCGATTQDFEIAVIRSARVYFINWASEYGDKPLFLHWGGANNIDDKNPGGIKFAGQIAPEVDAFKLLNKIGWRNGQYGNDLDGQSNFGYPALVRKYDRLKKGERTPDEHTPTAFVDELYKQVTEKRNLGYKDADGKAWDENFIAWSFADDKALSSPKTEKISFEFWGGKSDYDVVWEYSKEKNTYLRSNGGQPFTDFYFNNEQISSKNVVIQFVNEKGPVDKEGHMFYTTIGEGKALVFQNGDVIQGRWAKSSQIARTKFLDSKGDEITFVRGQIWIEAVPSRNEINY
ncbi:hypothetical protein A2955_03640 [Candidatus Woesebacteria bacterium RIFCSPLOWO2_01_FULL_37_19]|uniref:Lipoprotein YerB n=1 Tax=Candidatus Woesebacteria bacterium RIFCSPLOWO2_01_FULL_37_19 TaxID=1802514 RepID=A0A1F8BA81_9BACT|nr:MAG: hypothetical protein A2955_03640 [Candidatus Woesebacteria bacterium RIFCSPLOWO2_01_FULL_37_19]